MNEDGGAVQFSHQRGGPERPIRVFTIRQVTTICSLITALWAIGGKFLVESYVDMRVRTAVEYHNHDADAHARKFALYAELAGQDRRTDSLERKMDALTEKVAAMSVSLAELRGELKRGRAGAP